MDKFWKGPLRIIQNNLRASDATQLDVENLIKKQSEYGTNVIIANAGGLLCWYDSEISRQPHNPFLKFDYVKQVIHFAHQYGMKVLLRLDISNLSEKDLQDHPDWIRRDSLGNPVSDLGMLQSCFFSPMWQEYNFRLIEELMEKYQPDGLFYNAVHFGFCHCDICRDHYQKKMGEPLPNQLIVTTEEGRHYMKYRYEQMAAYMTRVKDAVHRYNPDAVVAPVGSFCTERPLFNSLSGWDGKLFSKAEDIQVSETVTSVMRKMPYWLYLPGENASASNAIDQPVMLCIHQACQLGRNAASAPAHLELDIVQAAFHGGGPAINMIGTFDQEDKKDLKILKKTFTFLKDNADCFTGFRQRSRVALVYSQQTNDYDSYADQTAFSPSGLHGFVQPTICGEEYRGIYEILVHQHIPFDIIHDGFLTDQILESYEFLILPGVTCLSEQQSKAVDSFVARGGKLIVTGALPQKDEQGRETGIRLKSLPFETRSPRQVDGYLMLENKALYPSLPETGLIGITFQMSEVTPQREVAWIRDMRYRCAPQNNKPEFSNIAEMTNQYGLYLFSYGQGRVLLLPWSLGRLYRGFGIYECPKVLKDLMLRMGLVEDIRTDAPYTVEVILGNSEAGETVSLINFTGISGKVKLENISLGHFSVSVRTQATEAISRTRGEKLPVKREGEFLKVFIPKIDSYEMVVLTKEK